LLKIKIVNRLKLVILAVGALAQDVAAGKISEHKKIQKVTIFLRRWGWRQIWKHSYDWKSQWAYRGSLCCRWRPPYIPGIWKYWARPNTSPCLQSSPWPGRPSKSCSWSGSVFWKKGEYWSFSVPLWLSVSRIWDDFFD